MLRQAPTGLISRRSPVQSSAVLGCLAGDESANGTPVQPARDVVKRPPCHDKVVF